MPEPVKLDFSKAVPVGRDEGVKLDFSKAVPLDSGEGTTPVHKSLLQRYESAVEPYTRIEAPDSSKKWNPSEAAKALGNIGAGGLGMILHPLNTLESIGGMVTAPFEMMGGKPFKQTIPGQLVESLKTNPYGTIESGIGAAALGEALPGRAGEVSKEAPVPRVLRPLVEKTREAQKSAAELADEYANAIKQSTQEITAKQSKEKLAAKVKSVEQARAYNKAVEETKAANKSAIRDQEKIAPTREKLAKSVQEMQSQIETARNNALKEGNKKYSTVNEALNHFQADSGEMLDAVHDSLSKITGTYSEPTILKSISGRLERGDTLNYEDLQGYYTELGRELSKGTLPGDLYHAYDTMQEAIGEDMQRIANENGKGAQLTDARNYWRRMKQAFGKPYNPTDAGNVVLEKTAGGAMRQAEQANRLRLLGSFDKTIPQTAEHIANLQKGIESLPKEQPLRSILKPLPEKPSPVALPKFEGTPEELAKQSTPLPKGAGKTVIDRADIEEAKRGRLQKDTDLVRTKGAFGATVLSLYALRSLLHGELGPLGSVPLDVGGALAVTHSIASLMERPSVVDFFSKATEKDIASIPPELRGDLPKLVKAAHQRGVRVSPALVAIAASSQANQKPVAAALKPQ
jgi:hypothetical protein